MKTTETVTVTTTAGQDTEFDKVTRGVVVDVNRTMGRFTIVPNGDLFQLDAFKERCCHIGLWCFVIGFLTGFLCLV